MDSGSNLQMIQEHDGEQFNNTQNMQGPPDGPQKNVELRQVDNDINFIQEQNNAPAEDMGRYENDEDELICGRFPHLDVCACEISC